MKHQYNPLITIIGSGKIALSIAKGLQGKYNLEVICRNSKSLELFESELKHKIVATLYKDANLTNKTVILCLPPHALTEVSYILKNKGKSKYLFSVLAGTPLINLSSIDSEHYARAMPNIAAEVLGSMTSLTGDISIQKEAIEIFSTIGSTIWFDTEKKLDIATAVAGSGPAYLSLIAEALIEGAVTEGLSQREALTLIQGLFGGFGSLVQTIHPTTIKNLTSTPGGITASGIDALIKPNIKKALIKAVHLAFLKTKNIF